MSIDNLLVKSISTGDVELVEHFLNTANRGIGLLEASKMGNHSIIKFILSKEKANEEDKKAIIRGAIVGVLTNKISFISRYVNVEEFSNFILSVAAQHKKIDIIQEIVRLELVDVCALNIIIGKNPQSLDWAMTQRWFNSTLVAVGALRSGNMELISKLTNLDVTFLMRSLIGDHEQLKWLVENYSVNITELTCEVIESQNLVLLDWLLETKRQCINFMLQYAIRKDMFRVVAYLMTKYNAMVQQPENTTSRDMETLIRLLSE